MAEPTRLVVRPADDRSLWSAPGRWSGSGPCRWSARCARAAPRPRCSARWRRSTHPAGHWWSRTGTTRARGTITAHRRAVVRRHPGPGEQVRSSVSEDEVGRGVRISGQDVAETQELAKRRSSGVRERAKASNASRSRSSIGPPACWPEDAPEAAQGCLLFVRGARGPVVGRALTHTGSVRNSDFRTRMGAALGPAHVDSFVADHVMGALGGRTAGQALADGEDLQLVWDAVCTELGIPAALRYGPDDPPARSR